MNQREKQVLAVSMLADGSSVRAVERVTRMHRDSVCRLLVRVGDYCAEVMDTHFQDLMFNALELDELHTTVHTKNRHLRPHDPAEWGDAYCFVAQCPETKLVPCFRLGKRTDETTSAFLADLASRLSPDMRPQVATDGFAPYRGLVRYHLGYDVNHMMIIKKFVSEGTPQHPYQPPHCTGVDRVWVSGFPDPKWTTTSHVEAQNAGLRCAMKRMNRLTLAFSKKWDNLLAALRLHFCAFNFVRKHRSLKTTPCVAFGVTDEPWRMSDLVPQAGSSKMVA